MDVKHTPEVEKSEIVADPIFLGLVSIAICCLFGLISIAVAAYFGLKKARIPKELATEVPEKLTKIEEHTKHIVDIKVRTERLDEFIRNYLREWRAGTIKLELKNLGKVEVTAEPGVDRTIYYITISKSILNLSFLIKKAKETEIIEKEKELFGKETTIDVLMPTRLIWHVPSTNPKICAKFIGFALKWLDTTYYESLKELKEYEEPIKKEVEEV